MVSRGTCCNIRKSLLLRIVNYFKYFTYVFPYTSMPKIRSECTNAQLIWFSQLTLESLKTHKYLVQCRMTLSIFISDKGGGKCFCTCLSVCLSVSKITQNACMDLDEMLRVDRCRDMDELINF